MADTSKAPAWMRLTLRLAALYNIIWGAVVILQPNLFFEWFEMEPPRYPEVWQCLGMVIGVYGVGYAIAARDPLRHWPITFVGLLGKILGPIGFIGAAWRGALPIEFGWTIITNDLIWWIPFGGILLGAWRTGREPAGPRMSHQTGDD